MAVPSMVLHGARNATQSIQCQAHPESGGAYRELLGRFTGARSSPARRQSAQAASCRSYLVGGGHGVNLVLPSPSRPPFSLAWKANGTAERVPVGCQHCPRRTVPMRWVASCVGLKRPPPAQWLAAGGPIVFSSCGRKRTNAPGGSELLPLELQVRNPCQEQKRFAEHCGY